MATTFLSYARRDLDFAQRLQRALAAAGEEMWVDWSGIPPTAEFALEINKGIEVADNFVFILSPDSLAATSYCRKEITHAAAMGKRMIPIYFREVPQEMVPESLAKLNYIFFRATDDFDAALEKLKSALHTDLVWTSTSSRLLVRALEWRTEGRDGSFLLRGKDLAEAEVWLAQAATKEGKPTELQSAYILESRKSAVGRQRKLLGAVAAALVVAIGLAIYATIQARIAKIQTGIAKNQTAEADRQRKAAETETKVAQQQTREATSRGLASEALLMMGTQPDLAVLLSIEALRSADTYDARNAAVTVGQLRPGLMEARRMPSGYEDAALKFSRDRRRFMTAEEDGRIVLWDAASLQPVWTMSAGESVTLSPDGRFFALYGLSGIEVRKTVDRALIGAKLTAAPDMIDSVAFSPDGAFLAASGRGPLGVPGAMQVWSLPDGTPLRNLADQKRTQGDLGGYSGVAFDPVNSHTLAAARQGAKVSFEDVRSGSVEYTIKVDLDNAEDASFIDRMWFSPDGSKLAVRSGYLSIEWYVLGFRGDKPRAHPDELIGSLEIPRSTTLSPMADEWFTSASFSPDGRFFAASTNIGDTGLYELNDAGPQATVDDRRGLVAAISGSLGFMPSGELAALTKGGDFLRLDAARMQGDRFHTAHQDAIGVQVSYSLDGRWIVSAKDDTTLVAWNATTLAPWWQAAAKTRAGLFSVAPDRPTAAFYDVGDRPSKTGPAAGLLRVNRVDLVDRRLLPESTDRAGSGEHALVSVAMGPAGMVAAASDTGVVRLWSGNGAKVLGDLHGAKCVSVSPDGRLLAVTGTRAEGIRLWDVREAHLSGPPLAYPPKATGEDDQFSSICAVFSPDGKLLASAGTELWIWNVESRQRIGQFLNFERAEIKSLAFSPDVRFLAVRVGSDGVELWDVETQQRLGAPLREQTRGGYAEESAGVAFSPDGRYVVAGGGRPAPLRRYENVLADWPGQGCRLTARNLTRAEWMHYLGAAEPYRLTCPGLPPG